MDNIWTAVADHLKGGGSRIVAPKAFEDSLPLVSDYRDPPSIENVDTLVLHKADFVDLPVPLVRDGLRDFTISFANEVFVVLARDPVEIEVNPSHLGALTDIRQWLADDGYRDGTEEALSRIESARMSATYIGQGRLLLQNAFGQLMMVNGADTSIVPHLIRDGWFDLSITKFLLRNLRAGQTFVDVGANFGTYALIAAGIVGDQGRVVAVEANPDIAEILHENMVMNGFGKRSFVFRNAAGQTNGESPLFSFAIRQGGSTMLAKVADQAREDYAERVTSSNVPCRTLDDMISSRHISAIHLLKIDVEGYELAVLKGAIGVISKMRPKILMEWHPAFMSDDSPSAIGRMIIDDLNYRLRRIETDGATRSIEIDELMTLDHSDVLAVPRWMD